MTRLHATTHTYLPWTGCPWSDGCLILFVVACIMLRC